MSSYIIAGSADSIDTAYCEQIARRIKAKYKNIDFRVVIKHPSEWEEYLQQICRIYGFLKKSNPIIYTFDGKIIGNKEAFMAATAKYFGLDEQSLNVENLCNTVNMKIATQQINRKHLFKNNIKTLSQKIQSHYNKLLKDNILKQQLKQKKQYLTNGISYIHLSIKGIAPTISFVKDKQIKVEVQEIKCSDIDLLAVSLNDQIKVEEVVPVPSMISAGKEAFVTTNNEKNNSEHDRMSEVSKTNKMHESIVSYDKDSKHMKQSSKSKLRIDEENQDCPDYIDYPMNQLIVVELADQFYVAFSKNSYITGEMIMYRNQDPNGNCLRVYNDNRPVNGHRVLIKEVYYDGEKAIGQEEQVMQTRTNQDAASTKNLEERGQKSVSNIEAPDFNQEQAQQKKIQNQKNQNTHENNENHLTLKNKVETEKFKTQPNIPQLRDQFKSGIIHDDDALSQIHSDLNLVSNLNYHTLFVQKPLSTIELKNLMYFIQQTDCIGCLQFLPENPNPKVKLYSRRMLLSDNTLNTDNNLRLLMPVEKFIEKQIQDEQFQNLEVPNERCYDFESLQKETRHPMIQINEIGFEHYIYQLTSGTNEQTLSKIIKNTIDALFFLEEQLKKDIGYNLILTKKFIMFVPLAQTYEIYNDVKLYLDGLAFLGYIHLAELIKPYQLQNVKIVNMGQHIRSLLSRCANGDYNQNKFNMNKI